MEYGDIPPLITDRETDRAFQKKTAERSRGLAERRCGAQPRRGCTVVRRPAGLGRDGGRLGGVEGCAGRKQRLQLLPLQSFLRNI
jgi:hypothetical protein